MVACGGILATVFFLEYGLGYLPCRLCVWQRIPYGVAMILSGLAFLGFLPRVFRVFWVLGGVFLWSFGLGAYHMGVEAGFWSFACEGGGMPISVEELENTFGTCCAL